jgi:hypothetical protein
VHQVPLRRQRRGRPRPAASLGCEKRIGWLSRA